MTGKEKFVKVCDFISPSDIVSELNKFLCDEDLHDFADYLIDEYELDIEDETFEDTDEDDYEYYN